MSEHSTQIKLGFSRITELLKTAETSLKGSVGVLVNLNTTQKGNLVAAINEVHAALANASSIDDTLTSVTKTWSSTKITAEITSAIANLIGGADAANDTLKEVADRITALAQADNGLVSATQTQSFTSAQQQQARDNINVYSKAEIGDITFDYAAHVTSIYNSP